jgi:nucleoid DNA-binding protein
MTITKKDISKEISQKIGIQEKNSSELLDSFISLITVNSVSNLVKIHNFGSFQYKLTPARQGRNPVTGVEHPIKALNKLNFRPSFKLKKIIN